MVQSTSWEVNWFAASQEIPRISRNPKVHYHTHRLPPPVSILGQPNPVHIPTSHLLEIRPNIIHPPTPRSPQWSLSLRFPHQDPIHPRANRQSIKSPIRTNCYIYIYSIPPDVGLQICPKYAEVNWRNKLRIKSASSWFSLHGCIEMDGQGNMKREYSWDQQCLIVTSCSCWWLLLPKMYFRRFAYLQTCVFTSELYCSS